MALPVSISKTPETLGGKARVSGTRVSVELILEKMAAGRTVEELLVAHPSLTVEGVQAALGYACEVVKAADRRAALS